MRRRDVLVGCVATLGGACLPSCNADEQAGTPAAEPYLTPPCDFDAIIDSFMQAEDTFIPLQNWLSDGIPAETLYAAAHTIAARIITPEQDVHLAAAVRAMHLMSQRVNAVDPLMPLFTAFETIRDGLTYFDPAAPVVDPLVSSDFPAPAEAADALTAALEAWDSRPAQAAMLALYQQGGRDAVIGPLTRYGQRDQDWVGHPTIWTAYAIRCLDAFGWQCAPAVLQALARAYAFGSAGSATSAAFYTNQERLQEVPAGWRDGADDPAAVLPLLDALRVGDADACVDTVIGALNDGIGPRTIWTALDIAAVELSVRWQHGSWGVHELDANNGFRYLQKLTPDPDTELLALLQSAAWRPLYRAHVDGLIPHFEEGLDAIEPETRAAPTLTEVFASLAGSRMTAARTLKAYFVAGGTAHEVAAAWPDILVRHASRDAHHYKFHAALLEETEAALPEWRETLLLGITMRGPSPADPLWERHDEAQQIIEALA